MALYTIKYSTENFYEVPVHEAYLEYMVMPCSNDDQFCSWFDINNSLNLIPQINHSLYGFKILRFHLTGAFTHFGLNLTASVEKSIFSNNVYKQISLKEEQSILQNVNHIIAHRDTLRQTLLTAVDANALPPETKKAVNEPAFQYVQRMTNFVRHFLFYETGVTFPSTTAQDVLALRKGVCQDFAHLFIAIMRTNGMPARYVSGYLNQEMGFTGAMAMHAWVEVWIPGSEWMGMDPTNNNFTNENYIKVAHGADYSDCMPLKGIIRAGVSGITHYTVEVKEQQNQ